MPPRRRWFCARRDTRWIYAQDRPFTGDRIYAPTRNPTDNDSNDRAAVSMPGWRAVQPAASPQ